MHIEIQKAELVKKLELLARVATKHLTLPVLQCVYIRTEKDKVFFAGTNLEMGITASVDAHVFEDGVVAVPSVLLLQTVQLLSDAVVVLKTDAEALIIESKGSSVKMNTFPTQEFPSIPELTGVSQKIDAALFALGLRTTAFAVSQSTIKPELGSVFVQQQKAHSATFVATDSFRLVEKTVSQQQLTLENPLLIPQKNALEIARVLEIIGSDPECIVGEGQVAFRFPDGTYVTTRLTEGSFPDYAQIIPKEYVTHVTVLVADLLHALKMTNVFANKFLQVTFEITEGTQALIVRSDNGEVGKTTERIPATIEGESLTLSFNQKYISDPLPYMPSESVVLHFAGLGRPMVMEGISEKTVRYLVMPMNK